MISFQKSTFICLDFPKEIAKKIRKIRLNLEPTIAWKPIVITLAGSSGCGHISNEQDILEANKILAELSKELLPISLQFSKINSFPKTDIYFFEFEDESLINKFHNQIKNCGIKFLDSEYPFKAHCTIHFKGSMNTMKNKKILNTEIPSEKFELDTMSLISDYNHLSRFPLTGTKTHQVEGV